MRSRTLLGLTLLAAGTATPVSAHDVERTVDRELVRLQGYRATRPSGAVAREIVLLVFGEEHRFYVGEWRVFALSDAGRGRSEEEPSRITLEGERAMLARVAEARPDQRLTLLAERRPGAAELFVLALDVCPE